MADPFAIPRRDITGMRAVVLAAVRETLMEQSAPSKKQQRMKTQMASTPFPATSYFAALLSALEASQSSTDIDALSALAYLLSRVIFLVPYSVIKQRFRGVANVLLSLCTRNRSSPTVLRPLARCLGSLLIALDSAQEWNQKSVCDVYNMLLILSSDHRPKLRHDALKVVSELWGVVVPDEKSSKGHKQAFKVTADDDKDEIPIETSIDVFLRVPENCRGKFSDDTAAFCLAITKADNDTSTDVNSATHSSSMRALGILKICTAFLTLKMTRRVIDELIRLRMLTGQVGIHVVAIQTVATILINQKNASSVTEVFDTVLEWAPMRSSVERVLAFIPAVSSGVVSLCKLDASLVRVGPRLMNVCTLLFKYLVGCQEKSVGRVAAGCLKAIFQECMDMSMIRDAVSHMTSSSKSPMPLLPMSKVILLLSEALKEASEAELFQILPLCTFLLYNCGEAAFPLMCPVVANVGNLADADHVRGKLKARVDAVIGAAIATMGPARFLTVVPLNVDPQYGVGARSRLWLIPLIKKYTRVGRPGCSLSYFGNHILPLVTQLASNAAVVEEKGASVRAKNMRIASSQIWSLLTTFVSSMPVDFTTSWASVAKVMWQVLVATPADTEAQQVILTTLDEAIATNVLAMQEELPDDGGNGIFDDSNRVENIKNAAIGNIAAIASVSKNILPTLFNMASSIETNSNVVAHVLEVVTAYAAVADQALVNTYFKTIVEKILRVTVASSNMEESDMTSTSLERTRLTDLALALVKQLNTSNVKFLYKLVRPQLGGEVAAAASGNQAADAVVKRAYKVLLEMCRHHPEFVHEHVDELRDILVSAMDKCSTSSKKCRIRCLLEVTNKMDGEQIQMLLTSVIPEVILCTREYNSKTRKAAFDFLIEMTKHMMKVRGEDRGVMEMIFIVSAGLAGRTPHMMAATIMALARILYALRDRCEAVLNDLVKAMVVMLGLKNREIIKAVLGFIKVVTTAVSPSLLLPYLPDLIPALLVWSSDSKNFFRLKVKVIVERLVRKLGYDVVDASFPEDHKKFLVHTRKQRERDLKLKHEEKHGKGTFDKDYAAKKASGILSADDDDNAFVGNSHSSANKEFENQDSDDELNEFGNLLGIDDAWNDSDPLDLLTTNMTKNKRSEKQKQVMERQRIAATQAKKGLPPLDPDGRIIVNESDSSDDANGNNDMDDDDNNSEDEIVGKTILKKRAQKRKSVDEDDDVEVENENQQRNKRRGTGQASLPVGRSATKKPLEDVGRRFKGKGAGDIMRPGDVQPYAYVPLDPTLLNRRSKAKQKSRAKLDSVVHSSKNAVSEARRLDKQKKRSGHKRHR